MFISPKKECYREKLNVTLQLFAIRFQHMETNIPLN